MRLRYETGTATLIHFLVMMLFGFINMIASIVDGCRGTDTISCIQSSGISLIFVLLLAGWFGFLAILGYAAQDQRSARLSRMLMAAEFLVFGISMFNAKHFPNILGLVTSLTDAAFAVWIMILAFRLSRAKGGRITANRSLSNRPRRRPAASASKE